VQRRIIAEPGVRGFVGVARKRFPVELRSWATMVGSAIGGVMVGKRQDFEEERKERERVYAVMAVKLRRKKKSGYGKKTWL
jgi:hypothetical protein